MKVRNQQVTARDTTFHINKTQTLSKKDYKAACIAVFKTFHCSLSVPCRQRRAPANGKIVGAKNPYLPEDMISFECDEGYRLIGEDEDTCLLGGSWDVDKTPTCQLSKYNISMWFTISCLPTHVFAWTKSPQKEVKLDILNLFRQCVAR